MFSCELCQKVFKQKCDFDKHKNRKAPCISLEKIHSLTTTKTDIKSRLKTTFDYCLDILRNEHLTGDKALRSLAYLLDLRLLEPRMLDIGIDSYPYDFSGYDDGVADQHKSKLLHFARFSNLVKEKEDNLPVIMKCLWDEILSEHAITKNIFVKGRSFEIQHQSTFKKLIDKLGSLNFEAIEQDILGEAYEEVIKDVMIGKTLGQFFTPPKVKQMMVNLIDPLLHVDGTNETIFDPAMGTGGFLITCLRNLLKQSEAKNIPLNWDFISQDGLGGREAELDTYQLAVSNMLIASGKMFGGLQKGDSIRDPITNKYDIILANPPFGIDGLIYAEIMSPLRNEYMPITSNSAVPLFLQAIIHMLKINGRCAVILPLGQELFSKNKALVAVREYLMKTCDLKEVISLPSGTFTHTPIKTCVLYFHKKREGFDVLETQLKYSKTTQKESERTYVFSKTHQTHKVKFYDYNTENETKHFLLEVDIGHIAQKNYSLIYLEYMKDEIADVVYEDGVVVRTLGEICSIDYGTRIVKNNNIEGEYPVYGSGRAMFSTNSYNREGYNILIGRFALSLECVRFVNDKIFLNDSGLSVKPKDFKSLLHKYVGYYLHENQNIIYDCARGTAQKNLNMDNFRSIKIPIPSLKRQLEIVEYMDFIYEKCIKTSTDKIMELTQLKDYCLNMQKSFGENTMKTLGEVCEILNGKRIVKGEVQTGEYPVLGGGGFTSFYTNEYTREGKTCKISREGMSLHNCVMILNEKYYLNSQAFTVKSKRDILTNEYLWHYLDCNKEQVFKCGRGTAQKAISIDEFNSIKIPIPFIERQQQITEYCEFNDELIQQLKKEIEQNKKQAKLFLAGAVSLSENLEVEEIVGSVFTEESDLKEPDEEALEVDETSTNCVEVDEFVKPPLVIEDVEADQVNHSNTKKRENVDESVCLPESKKKTKMYPMFSRGGKK